VTPKSKSETALFRAALIASGVKGPTFADVLDAYRPRPDFKDRLDYATVMEMRTGDNPARYQGHL